ncbi:amino acid adenylation domain-containing protein [Kitasatospora sp. NPDC056273]|uniref:amino acid adenylation domain-containing protein n=1 Tax=Kitasatospora sp. NPDC056273 TaxID=3345769 RepID=UPI0035E1C139
MARQTPLTRLIADLAAQAPDTVAVRHGNQEITYAALDEAANRLAHYLRDAGVRPESLVGTHLPHSAELPSAVLGVWRAGAVAVPLDADGPAAHLRRIQQGSAVGVVLTLERFAAEVAGEGVRVVLLDADEEDISFFPATDPGATSESAWVSRGPDGTALVVEHAALANQVRWTARRHGIGAADRILHLDRAVDAPWPVFTALAAGATAVLATPEEAADPGRLAHLVAGQAVTVLPATPDLLADLVGGQETADRSAVRLVLAVGTPLEADLGRSVLKALPGAALWHVYGPGALAVTAHPFDAGQDAPHAVLGRPIDNVRVLVLDEEGSPVPPGVPGEIHVAGLGAPHGYLGAPALTAAALVPAQYGPPGSRLHRTGDLARWRTDGALEYLGRTGEVTATAGDDRQAPRTAGRPPYTAPATEAEQIVAQAWSRLLEVERVGADDNFFQLGGYSLVITQLAEQLRAATGRQIALTDLFTAVTVREQARLIDPDGGADRATPPAVTAVPRDTALPLSYGQRRLWFMDSMQPQSPEWVSSLSLRVAADTGPEAVRAALDALGERHEALRTRYLSQDGEPLQVVEAHRPIELKVVEGTREELLTACQEQFDTGFDLSSGRLWRALLCGEGDGDQLLLITFHHIACDGWSTAVLESEFRELVEAHRAGRSAELPELHLQYADFAAWQQEWRSKERLAESLDHWRTALAGAAPLELPVDHPRPAERDGRGGVVTFTVPGPLAAAAKAFGRRHEATPFMTLLTTFGTLLARHTGQWDVVVGAPVAGRTRAETEPMVGFFLNSLVLRCRLDDRQSFATALQDVRTSCLSAFAHQDLPFEHLVEELRPERDLSRTPLYQVAFNMHDEQLAAGMPDREDIGFLRDARRVAKTDLTLYVRAEADGSWTGAFEYASSLFEHATIERLADHFLRLLESAVTDPGSALAELDILTDAEREELSTGWNDTRQTWEPGSVIDLFEARAAETPDAPALISGGQVLTYRELDEQANRMAHHLIANGARPDTLVGVCLERGPGLVTALLGVWKAGAGYVPLDPANPAERLSHVLADCGAPVLVTESPLTALTESFAGARVFVDRDEQAIAARRADAPARPGDPDHLAYVIYTSGSTGKPKGVMVTQHGLVNHLRWAARDLVTGEGGAPLFSSVAFDLPATNLYVPLITGQPVHVLPADLDLSGLGPALAAAGPFSFVKLTPGHLELLSHQLTAEQCERLARLILVAGEALTARTANHWREILGAGRLINEYGPTEASIGSTAHPVVTAYDQPVPLGGSLPNTTGYVLDGNGRLAPVGVAGELHIGGDGVARGYLGRPDLTAEKFVPDPFGPAGSRLYRTGDLTRRLPDGAIEFLGRIDDQVKLRGYRIELGEIQAQLTAIPGIRDAVVVLRTDDRGEKSLAAYVVPESGTADPQAIRAHLAGALPEYMVPATVAELLAIPLTSNGKLDHRALPAVEAPVGDHCAPATPTEERIAEIWADILGLERVSVLDSFFEIGGHSILAIRMTAQLQDEFDVNLTIRTVFDMPTVRGLAEAIENEIKAEIERLADSELIDN